MNIFDSHIILLLIIIILSMKVCGKNAMKEKMQTYQTLSGHGLCVER